MITPKPENINLFNEKNFNQGLYSNPQNLIYYLINQEHSRFTTQIIKKLTINSNFGQLEIGILGASHYFKLENYFTEILTCEPEEILPSKMIQTHKNKNKSISFHQNINHLNYTFQLQNEKKPDSSNFMSQELKILSKNHSLIHAFRPHSAITALDITINHSEIILQSLHTYPEFHTIVQSNTTITF